MIFTNEETVDVPWSLDYLRTKIVATEKFDEVYENCGEAILAPVTIFPSSGILVVGGTQSVDLTFTASIPQADILSLLTLKSGCPNYEVSGGTIVNGKTLTYPAGQVGAGIKSTGFGSKIRTVAKYFNSQDILLVGTGASSKLLLDCTELKFGTLRVLTSHTMELQLYNVGILGLDFYFDTSSLFNNFTTEPEQGRLEGKLIITQRIRSIAHISYTIMLTYRGRRVHCGSNIFAEKARCD